MLYPFLFRLANTNRDTWVVKIARHDYSYYDCRWMCDPEFGTACLVPSVDITEEQHTFYSEEEAFDFIHQWWCQQ